MKTPTRILVGGPEVTSAFVLMGLALARRGDGLSPSPRLRGEGRGEGALSASGLAESPPHPALARRPLPASGEK